MHLVVLYGYQDSDNSSEQLQLTDQLVDAALSELAVVALAKGISAGLWVALEASWAFALEREPAVTCKRTWESDSGNRRDFSNWVSFVCCGGSVL